VTLSLRARLLVGVVALVLAGLLIADTATYVTLQRSLVGHVDEQLLATRDRLVGPAPGPPHRPPAPDLPPQSTIGLAAPHGPARPDIVMTDYGVEPPQVPITTVKPQVTIEFQLVLTLSAT
jgi:hypothetical protein